MKIVIVYPSRGRPDKFFEGLESIYNNAGDINNIYISCNLDEDDPTMCNEDVINRIKAMDRIGINWGTSKNKIDAINRHTPDPLLWDILIVFSDDMRFTFYGFDEIIRSEFKDSLDWLVHLPDQDEKEKLNTMYIAGRDFYKRFGYIYHPAYKSLFCDTELMEIAKSLDRYKYVHIPGVVSHLLPAYGHAIGDEMWQEQQRIGWTEDQRTYLERKAKRLNDNSVFDDWFDAYKNDSL